MRLSSGMWVAVVVAITCVGASWVRPAWAQDKGQTADTSASAKASKDKSAAATAGKDKPAVSGDASGKSSGAETKKPTGGDKSAPSSSAAATGSTDAKATSAPEAKAAGEATAGSEPAAAKGSTAAPSAAGASTAQTAGVDGSTYVVRMRDLAQRIDELKEQIRRSHTRLSLLSDTILSGGVGGARAEITFTNEMSSAFRLVRALFVLDGAVQYNKQDDTGVLAEQKSIPIFSGSIPPGDHTLQVLIKLQGYGYGVFSYLRGYKFEIKSTHSFTVAEGKTMRVEAVAWEKGGVTTPLEQRPAIRYVEKFGGASGGKPEPAAPAKSSPGPVKASISVGTGGQ
jgi:hypothetical protein